MRWTRIIVVIIGSVWFFPVGCTASLFAGTHIVANIDSRDVSKGETVHSRFSVVFEEARSAERFQAISLYDLTRIKEAMSGADAAHEMSFLMSHPSGHLDADTSSFFYQVIEQTAQEQVIEVVETYHDGDNTIWSRYKATESEIIPISSRKFYFGYMFAAAPYAFGFALFLYAIGRYLRSKGRTDFSAFQE
jgi:hypothetical protein